MRRFDRRTFAVVYPVIACVMCLLAAPRFGQAQAVSPPKPIRYALVDCHLHLVDFLQHTDGIKAVLAALNRSGVQESMICGMPVVKQWPNGDPKQPQPQYYLDDDSRCYWYSATDILVARELEKLNARDRARFHPFICGFNSDDRNAIEHVKRMLEWYPGLWQGIGEVMTRHDDLTALTYGDVAHADSPSLDPLYDLAADNDMPVSVHSDVSSVWKREPIYLHEIEGAAKNHPRTRIIWCHAGVSRRIDVPTLPAEVRRLLTAYPNLYVDLSWVVFETYLTKNGQPVEDWVSLIEAFPNRFMIGSDKVGKFDNYHEEMQKYYVLLDALKPETARKVAHDNFLAVLPRKKQAQK